MRLVKVSGGAGESAKNRPRHPGRITAHYPILSMAKILSHTPLFGVLRHFSRISPITTCARGESVIRTGPGMRYIAGNSDYSALFCITGNA